ncbi:phage portal protein, partial [Apilactobacillus micheneri]|uniref:phage portal protein n=2 Tax=Apilactobacillus TaxID=2767877 RepID=UPI00112D8032
MLHIFDNLKNIQKRNNDLIFNTVVNYVSSNNGSLNNGSLVQNSDIYSVITQIASDIASTPMKATNNIVAKELNFQFLNKVMIQTLIYGNCYVLSRNFKIIDNSDIEIQIDDDNNIKYLITDNDTNDTNTYDSKDILHFRINPSDIYGLVGVSPLESLRDTLNIQKSANKVLQRFYDEGVHGSLVVKLNTTLNKEQRDKARDELIKSMNSNLGAIVTDESTEIDTLKNNFDGDILKIAQNTDYLSKQVAKAFSVPNFVLGVEDNHSNQEQVQNTYNNALMNIYQPIIE